MNLIKSISLKLNNFSEDQIKEVLSNTSNPITLSYISKYQNKPITVPIWTYIHDNKFYIFTSKKSKKVQSIESGNVDVSILIINKEFYPHPVSKKIPYIGIKGKARIVYYGENQNLVLIHQKLLLKYDKKLSQGWIKELYEKIEKKPKDVWLIEINPMVYYSY
jgi:nitroimidazol reductase NimA-like FMN-containing flavoprotein (pyridoxamine 5'-phosphate oxidase superfamily)